MRRGSRGSNLRGPWRRRDDAAIPSAVYFNRWWTARNCVCVTVLAACSMAVSILIWSSRPGRASRPDVSVHGLDLQSSNPGIVFPLYHHYRQFGNGSHGMGRRERSWRENRAGNGRGIRGENALMNVHGGHRLDLYDIDHFYIEMKLGVPPVKYNFHIDTGSGLTWVSCNIRGQVSKLATLGPHGFFVPEDNSYVKCVGDTATLCRQLQASSSKVEPCVSDDYYQCIFMARYADASAYVGFVVNGSFTVAMEDKSEMNVFGAFGCMVEKLNVLSEILPLTADGLIGLGKCKGTLLDQWVTSKAVSQSVLGVCLGKGVEWTTLPSPAAPVGYISMGMDFKEKFDETKSVWAKLTDPGNMISCEYTATLLSVLFGVKGLVVGGVVFLDTGSDLSYLATNAYGPLLQTLDDYATRRGFLRVADNHLFVLEEQRLCWEPPAQILVKASPIHDFPPLTFAFEGISVASDQYFIVQPVNYLIWDAHEKKLCVNILEQVVSSESLLGADLMREHLFVFDIENQRFRWQSSTCELN